MSQKRSRAAFESDQPPHHAPYALYGTPLPAYDPEARDDGSYVPIWKQEVTDERGRKRLHGAFTGGFSAGYFNTVGSKEGWTPSTFVSSRTNRAKKDDGAGRRVEDFMDEEDLAERAESQQLSTNDAFAGLGSGGTGFGSGKGMFADLFRATGETMGVKLLQRMGWRPGQGIGPKVRRRARGDKEGGEVHLFAPENSRMISFNRKVDRKGIGFAGEERLGESRGRVAEEDEEDEQDARILQSSRSKLHSKPKKSSLKKAGGFGAGVLNDTGSDDEDEEAIMGPRISCNRVIGGEKIKPKKKGGLTASNAVQKPISFTSSTSKKLDQRSTALAGFRKCHDGHLPLDGFVLTSAPLVLVVESKYPPPTVPEGWTPARLSTTASAKESKEYQSTADAAKASTLDPKTRAALLGEQQLPGKSVFDFLSPAARDKLAVASGRSDLPAALGEKAPEGYQQSESDRQRSMWDLVPALEKATAEAALQRGRGGFMPYAEDESKRDRYVAFLELKAGLSSTLPTKLSSMSTDDWAKELQEFARAAEVFRPISGLMASRFTSSTSSGPRLASDAPDAPAQKDETGREGPAEQAAKLGMFGPGLTRTKQQFFPTRLLCKRFNVKPPSNVDPSGSGNGEGSGSGGAKEVVSQASLDRMMREVSWTASASGGSGSGGKGFVSSGVEGGDDGMEMSARQASRQAAERVDAEKNDALEGERPGEDIFKAIFGSDDEDE